MRRRARRIGNKGIDAMRHIVRTYLNRLPGGSDGPPAGWSGRRKRTALLAAAVVALAMVPVSASGEDGNIGANSIEVSNDANLYPSPATKCQGDAFDVAPAKFDWVKDCLPNDDLVVGVDAAAQRGNWNGFRVTDGIAGGDQDIFLTGGKENLLNTWNPGPGSVGSSKYDITQAYIANNSTDAFFGMERRGNNGTTAFDWEFNRLAPAANNPAYIPTRSECDVLVTFEMQGSGKSGSATPYVFRYDDPDVANTGSGNPKALNCDGYVPASGYAGDTDTDGKYVTQSTAGVVTAINNTPVHSAPWGTVDSGGSWTNGDLENFEFAEAKVPLSLLGIEGGDTCTNISRYVQVRTRASSTDNSDLKDLTKIFSFDFFAPENPTQTVSELCDAKFAFDSSVDSGTAPDWTFSIANPTQVTLSGVAPLSLTGPTTVGGKSVWTATSAFSGQVHVTFPDGVDSVSIAVAQSLTDSNSCSSGSSGTVTVHRGLGVTASLTPTCGSTFSYDATSTGGTGTKTYSWTFQKLTSTGPDVWTDVAGATSTTRSGSIDMDDYTGGGEGSYRGVVTVTDEADAVSGKPACTATYTTSAVTVYDDLSATADITPDCDSTFAWGVQISGGKAPYDGSVQVQKLVSGAWTNVGSATTITNDPDGTVSGSFDIAADSDAGTTGVQPFGEGSYRIHVQASDDQATPCTTTQDSAAKDIRYALTATAAKQSADGSALSVAMNGGTNALAADNPTFQWQYRVDDGSWTDLPAKTTEDFSYSTFDTQDTSPAAVTFTVASGAASGDYAGQVWAVDLRLHVERTLNGQVCKEDSAPVTVKKVTAVDP
jgi:hypothetical protein